MSKVLEWIKANPILLLSVGLLVISLVGLGVVHRLRGSLVRQIQDQAKVLDEIESLMNTRVKLPAEDPEKEPETSEPIILNEAAVQQLERLYSAMRAQLAGIDEIIRRKNYRGRQIMLEGLLPEPPEGAIRITVKHEFRRQLLALLQRPPVDQPFAGLNAGMPPSGEEITRAIQIAQTDFLSSLLSRRSIDQLTPGERQNLVKAQQRKVLELLRDRAAALDIYAYVPQDAREIVPNSPFPLDDSAIRRPEQPEHATPEEIWEGQMSLWIQQDLIEAIARANRVDQSRSGVLEAPVKRLLRVAVVPGCVGLWGNRGGFVFQPGQVGQFVNPYAMTTAGPPGTAAPTVSVPSPTTDDYSITPTGRVSNSVFDVRHVWLTVVVDVARLPELFEALAQVNFMTVLAVRYQDVDEYQALAEGFVYGSGDVVQAEMLIETIWFRSWTKDYMPTAIKEKLGVPVQTTASAALP